MKILLVVVALLPLALGKAAFSRDVGAEASLRQLSRAMRSFVSKELHKRGGNSIISADDRCDKLVSAWKEVVNVIEGSQYAGMIQQMEQQMMAMHGIQVDLSDPSAENIVDQSFCVLAKVDSQSELAGFLNMPLEHFQPMYHQGVNAIRQLLRQWESIVDSPYISSDDANVLRTIIRFFNTFDEIGLFSLK